MQLNQQEINSFYIYNENKIKFDLDCITIRMQKSDFYIDN